MTLSDLVPTRAGQDFLQADLLNNARTIWPYAKGQYWKGKRLSAQISKDITRQNKTRLIKLKSKTRPKALWSVVRQLTGAKRDTAHDDGITADSLNTHYASVSTDPQYTQPSHKFFLFSFF